MNLSIYIDHREDSYIKEKLSKSLSCNVSFKNLDEGDYRIEYDGRLLCIIERKSLTDLAASLKDGRYKKQKDKLVQSYPASKIYYILEGHIDFSADTENGNVNVLVNGILYKAIVTCMLKLMIKDNIQVINTKNLEDTVGFFTNLCARITEDPTKYIVTENDDVTQALAPSVVVNKHFSSTLDPQQYFLNVLCNVPGVSIKSAKAIANYAGSTLSSFMHKFEGKNREEIKTELVANVFLTDENGKKRRISEKCIDSIIHLFFEV